MSIIPRTLFVLALATALLSLTGYARAQGSASCQITKSVMSGGGTRSPSAGYELTGAYGQRSPVEVSDSAGYTLGSGF